VKPNVVSADVLFEEFRGLRWEWVAGLGVQRRFDEVAVRSARSGADLVGYLNYIHPYRVQILGEREIAYLTNATPEDCKRRIARIVTLEPPVLVLADGQVRPTNWCRCASARRFRCSPRASRRPSSSTCCAPTCPSISPIRTTMHGVFMDILGLGVLITGESGLGKSELGLELISRGNGLVADDAVDLFRINQTTIEGKCPELLQNLLEVRGIGLLDIRAIFGETAVRRKMRLKLIVHLVRKETLERDYERLPYEPLTQDVLGVPVLKVVIQVVAGATLPCWWRLPCATPSCSCAASIPTRNLSSATAAPWTRAADYLLRCCAAHCAHCPYRAMEWSERPSPWTWQHSAGASRSRRRRTLPPCRRRCR
jgi:HPr kinase/phosphorylase